MISSCPKKKYFITLLLVFVLFSIILSPVTAFAEDAEFVYIGGDIIGFEARLNGVLVTETGYAAVGNWQVASALKKGDIIRQIEGENVENAEDIAQILDKFHDKESVTVVVERNGVLSEEKVCVFYDAVRNKRMFGVEAKDSVCGLGTITFTTATGEFYGLGHEVVDFDTGYNVISDRGTLYSAAVTGVVRGKKGAAGAIKGCLTSKKIGMIDRCGKFGIKGRVIDGYYGNDSFRLGGKADATMGNAKICSAVSGKKEYYDIKIVKTYRQTSKKDKSMIIKVVDSRLLDLTGGIIQGMSGSPIVQNGIIVGAVTHVFTGDPTMGYGVYADWQR